MDEIKKFIIDVFDYEIDADTYEEAVEELREVFRMDDWDLV